MQNQENLETQLLEIATKNYGEVIPETEIVIEEDESSDEENKKILNRRLFKGLGKSNLKTLSSKGMEKNKHAYENLAVALLERSWPDEQWGCFYDKDTKSLFVCNVLSPKVIPNFKLYGMKDLDTFIEFVIASGKKIMVESNLEREISEEEKSALLDESTRIVLENIKNTGKKHD